MNIHYTFSDFIGADAYALLLLHNISIKCTDVSILKIIDTFSKKYSVRNRTGNKVETFFTDIANCRERTTWGEFCQGLEEIGLKHEARRIRSCILGEPIETSIVDLQIYSVSSRFPHEFFKPLNFTTKMEAKRFINQYETIHPARAGMLVVDKMPVFTKFEYTPDFKPSAMNKSSQSRSSDNESNDNDMI